MHEVQGDMQIIISDEVVKEALQHYFDTHDVPLFIADASIQSVGFMLSVDFKWKQQSRQPKSLSDLKRMFPPTGYEDRVNKGVVTPQEIDQSALMNQMMAQQQMNNGQVSQDQKYSIADLLAQLEETQ